MIAEMVRTEVQVLSDRHLIEVDDLIHKHPGMIRSWIEAVQMAQALRTVDDLKNKKNGKG